MRALVVLIFLIAFPVANGTFRPIQEADFWQPMGLDLGFAKRFLSDRVCQIDSARLSACLRALRLADQKAVPSIRSNHVDEHLEQIDRQTPAKMKSMIFARMVNDFLRFFDAHAQVLPLEYYRAFLLEPSKDYYGVGLLTEMTKAGLMVRQVLPFTSSSLAGVRIHDRILRIGDIPVPIGPDAQTLLSRLNAPAKKPISVDLERNGQVIQVRLQPSILVSDDYTSERLRLNASSGLFLTIRRFSHGLCAEVERSMLAARSEGWPISWMIIDLRDNPGGVRWEAQCIASLFVGRNAEIEREPLNQVLPADFGFSLPPVPTETTEPPWHQKAVFAEIPVLILVSAKTKSSAEILSAILQDNDRAWIIGERTFGKGTSQMVSPVAFHDQLRLSHTVWRFLRRDGSGLQIHGVTPNFSQPFRRGATGAERQFFREMDWEKNAVSSGGRVSQWQETRTDQVNRLNACVRRGAYDGRITSLLGLADQQKAFAFALLHCLDDQRNIRSVSVN